MPFSWLVKPMAIASAIAFSTLGLFSRKYDKARLYFNVTIYLTTLGAASIWGVIVSILATAAGQRLNINYYVARSFYQITHRLVGIKMLVEGEEHLDGLLTARGGKPQSAVVLANHQSMLDILFLGRIFPQRTSIMAKKELQWTPLLGQYMSLAGTVFINRKNRKDAVRSLTQAGEDMKRRGVSLWVFPEGTRSLRPDPVLLPFKKGAFHLAVQAQVPIVAIVCENYHHIFDGRTRFNPGTLKIRILPPISTAGMTIDDVNRLTLMTQEAMEKALRELSTSAKTTASITEAEGTEGEASSTAVKKNEAEEIRHRVLSPSPEDSEPVTTATTEDEMDDDAVVLKRPKVD